MIGTIQRSEDVYSTWFDDNLIMMSVRKGRYYGLNEVGSRIWELLEHSTTEAEVAGKVLAEYEVAPEICANEVREFLTRLRERGLLIEAA